MQYITIKRYKRDDARGRFNIPYGTEIEESGGLLWYKGRDICSDHAAVMREYFTRNDDGRGLERGKLTQTILTALRDPEGYDERWEAVREDALCRSYRKGAASDTWLWSIDFFNAPVEDLAYIAGLTGVDTGKEKS